MGAKRMQETPKHGYRVCWLLWLDEKRNDKISQ